MKGDRSEQHLAKVDVSAPQERSSQAATPPGASLAHPLDLRPSSGRRSVASRLLVSYVVVLAAFALTVGWSIQALREAARDAKLLRAAYVPLLLSIEEALAAQNVLNAQLNHITAARNPVDVRQWIETARRLRPLTFQKIRKVVQKGLPPELDRSGLRDHVLAGVSRIEGSLEDDTGKFNRMFLLLNGGQQQEAEKLRDELVATEADGAKQLRDLRVRVDGEMQALTSVAQRRESRSILLLIGLSILTLVMGLAISIYARRVLAPLTAVTERARAVASGDLTPRKVVATKDEIGELASTFESMVEAIQRARAELVQAERLATIGKMAAHITHEVRNPLSSISLNLELLEEELAAVQAGREAAQLLSAIRAEVERLSQIAEQYLAAARRPRLQLEAENVEDVVRECYAFVRPEFERAGLECRLEISDELPKVDVDEGQLRQALRNLLRNAREAAPKGGQVVLSVSRPTHDTVTINVDDDGPGVPESLRSTIFDPFCTTKERGTGLGLAVTRAIVEAHQGTIDCQSRDGRGTRFSIALPAKDGDGQDGRPQSTT